MAMKNYKPVYDGVEYKTPMQRMREQQEAFKKAVAEKQKEEEKEVADEPSKRKRRTQPDN